ncbi:hypothetical protein H310_12288 [Aphanomyces invadans]|uniref:N-acetyltransferase domain-containing protein n=1 Tax=Aphanomyces invadans TaxID=157072 RepID=A0A024TIU1_9STRA|nr:hypothetical protein H310_12288 [Aphanomyces invadans]ETV93953.1 hypothetical protein H310_12288 [Aphanomyces invadans]|eukprot:XP_008877513.1 hypothetical protein H310_12288 [Aphanomyces invadans]
MEISAVDDASIAGVRRLNLAALPIPVQDHIYREAMCPPIFSQVAQRNGKVLGAVIVHDDSGDARCIRTIAVDIRSRGQGIGRMLLEKVVQDAMLMRKKLYLHVQVDNDDAIRLYKSVGFTVDERVANYYRRVSCVDCFVMSLPPAVASPHERPPGVSGST